MYYAFNGWCDHGRFGLPWDKNKKPDYDELSSNCRPIR